MGRVVIQVGQAGVGKSTRIARAIARELSERPFGGRLLWVVPQDASYACERLLMREAPVAIRAEVLTVPRLAEQMNAAIAVAAGQPVNMTGKRLLLADVFREVGDQLQVLHRAAPSIRFLDSVLEVFTEMAGSLVSPHQVEALLETAATRLAQMPDDLPVTGSRLIGKLRDLCTLYHRYQVRLTRLGLYDPVELPALLAEREAPPPGLEGARVYVDGFDHLPARDTRFLLAVARAADETVISVTLDPAWLSAERTANAAATGAAATGVLDGPRLLRVLAQWPDPERVWAPQTLAWVLDVMARCRELGLSCTVEEVPPPPDGGAPARRVVERALYGAAAGDPELDGAHAAVAAAQNLQREADGVARRIVRLVGEGRYRFGDIAVLTTDLGLYGPLLRDAFARHGVDGYVDDFPPLAVHPLGRFILALLDTVEDGVTTESASGLLKTEFCGLRRQDADWLEAYLRRHEVAGVDAFAAGEPWSYAYDARQDDVRTRTAEAEDARADELRRALADRFLEVWRQLRQDPISPGTLARCLWNALERADAKRILAEWMVGEAGAVSPLQASLHEQAWQRLLALLQDLADTLPDAPLSRAFLFELVRTDLMGQSLSTIPAGIDQVLVTEVRRARALHVPVVFVVGATDGALPRRIRPQGLLQDEERLAFERAFGQAVGLTASELQLCERSALHTALTRAADWLFVTYPLSDEAGKAVRPARWVQRLGDAPENLVQTELWLDEEDWDPAQVWTPRAALDRWVGVVERARHGERLPAVAVTVFDGLSREPAVRGWLEAALGGLGFSAKAGKLPAGLASALYGWPLQVNVHQLEAFAACPFQHFLRHGLRLTDEDAARRARAARGNLIHDVLEQFVRDHQEQPEAWRALSDDEVVARVRDRFQAALGMPRAEVWRRRAVRREAARFALAVVEKAALVLTRHVRYGRFVPWRSELVFGDEAGGGLPPLEVPLPGGGAVRVRGRIDRIDLAVEADRSAYRILDYKTNMSVALDLVKVHHGLQLQLPLYAVVIARHAKQLFGRPAEPAGILYLPVGRSPRSVRVPQDADAAHRQALRSMRPRGLMAADGELVAWMDERLPTGADTELFGKLFTQSGNFVKGAPVADAAAWRGMFQRVTEVIQDASARMAEGEIDIHPYQLRPDDHACRRCPFQAVCHLDRRWERPMRHLARGSREDVLALWAQAAGEGESR
ncbi:PD-(D/E)XK nuclease family protein [Alicyclobacillus sp.]|uniref:PD-(D/E)XK nuclease family protein n=1 Tax=Alicyclobacillus sp. TaxID=61169 RepID=UPI0025C48C8C|nr:PD-(D/E)XK nuclease family protein [Alicyclobacillus sp.]MCL6516952.1 PD-(D/E)XK nuclease family protein [Alicyclobacillus sp.]